MAHRTGLDGAQGEIVRESCDIVVVGAGHAGCEAALAASRLGRRVCMVTMSEDHIGRLSCNPAVGGLAKGNLVRDRCARRRDGASRGQDHDPVRAPEHPQGLAVQASRAQVDIDLYPAEMRRVIDAARGLRW